MSWTSLLVKFVWLSICPLPCGGLPLYDINQIARNLLGWKAKERVEVFFTVDETGSHHYLVYLAKLQRKPAFRPEQLRLIFEPLSAAVATHMTLGVPRAATLADLLMLKMGNWETLFTVRLKTRIDPGKVWPQVTALNYTMTRESASAEYDIVFHREDLSGSESEANLLLTNTLMPEADYETQASVTDGDERACRLREAGVGLDMEDKELLPIVQIRRVKISGVPKLSVLAKSRWVHKLPRR